MSEPVISVTNLSKGYRIYEKPSHRLWEALTRATKHRVFHALKGIDLEVLKGEGIGIIGENGAGKSTLLKILSGVVEPTSGKLKVRGKVAAILELGSGFHPEFTGRQNIVLAAAMLGLEEKEIAAKLDLIVDFSELGEFIEQPVKCYSTGMVMRLAFSVATQVDPDVLIVDEALSVGDGYFQKKCMDHLYAFLESGRTLLFCSHAMYYVTSFCKRAVWIRQGEIVALGPSREVVQAYENFLAAKSAPVEEEVPKVGERPMARIAAVRISPPKSGESFTVGESWRVEVEIETDEPERQIHVGMGLNRIDGVEVASFSSHHDGCKPLQGATSYQCRLNIPALPLAKGEFMVYLYLLDEAGLFIYDQWVEPNAFNVESPSYVFGLVRIPHQWEFSSLDPEDLPAVSPNTPLLESGR